MDYWYLSSRNHHSHHRVSILGLKMIPIIIELKLKDKAIKPFEKFIADRGDALQHLKFKRFAHYQKSMFEEFLDSPKYPSIFFGGNDETVETGLGSPVKGGVFVDDEGYLKAITHVTNDPSTEATINYFVASLEGFADEGYVRYGRKVRVVEGTSDAFKENSPFYKKVIEHTGV